MPRKLRIGYPRAYRVSGDSGTYTQTGQDASFGRAARVDAAQGSYAVTGQDAALSSSASASITPALTLGYVDTSGDRQSTTVVSGVTSITGVAPFLVAFDASGTRAASATTDHEAFFELGYELVYGDAVSGTWPFSGASKSYDRDGPIGGWAYETPGTYTARLKVRDASGNQSEVTCTIVVTARPAATNLPVSNGSWGTLVSGTHYSLDKGSNYSAWGSPPTNGLHGIVFTAVGSGADPIVASWSPDSRNDQGTSITRTRNVRFVGIDVAGVTGGNVGYDFCGIVNGRCRSVSLPATAYGFNEAVSNSRGATVANNCRYVNGLFLFNAGEIQSDGSGYALIGTAANVHAIGCTFNKTGADGGSHCIRGIYHKSSFRHNLVRNTAASSSFWKINGLGCLISSTPDTWRSDDRAGDYAAGLAYGYPTSCMVIARNLMGASGDTTPTANAGFGPQNIGPGPNEGVELSCYENNAWFAATPSAVASGQDTLEYRGRGLGVTNNKANSGAGAEILYSEDTNAAIVPPGWRGPYYSGYTRPVPV